MRHGKFDFVCCSVEGDVGQRRGCIDALLEGLLWDDTTTTTVTGKGLIPWADLCWGTLGVSLSDSNIYGHLYSNYEY
jgi:hypothetical protein